MRELFRSYNAWLERFLLAASVRAILCLFVIQVVVGAAAVAGIVLLAELAIGGPTIK